MSDLKGMDITAARQLAGKIVSDSAEVGAKLLALAHALPNVQWLGTDGDKFRTEYDQVLRQLQTAVEQRAEEWSSFVHKNADEQQNASS